MRCEWLREEGREEGIIETLRRHSFNDEEIIQELIEMLRYTAVEAQEAIEAFDMRNA